MKIGILGGSFDPIHEGHLTLARESQRQFKLDKILFVPVFLSPLKFGKTPLTTAALRARMVGLSLKGEPSWELCGVELSRSGVSYTVDTLRHLRKSFPPPHQLFFIAGADAYEDLKNWKEPDEIMKLSEWIVAQRPTHPLPVALPTGFHLLKMRPIAVSASEIRERVREGRDISVWVPRPVADYIKRMGLYREKAV